jgi:probable rRNA maturation factor
VSLRLLLRNRQRAWPVDSRRLRRIAQTLLLDSFHVRDADLGIYLVAAPEITRLNEQFLQHRGSTDVLAFDYSDGTGTAPLHGEIFVCVDEAVRQARRFRTTWPCELVRYLVHGLLHLHGYDDHRPADRRRMKHQEDRLLRALRRQFDLPLLARPPAGSR